MYVDFNIIKYFIFVSVALYFVFDYLDQKKLKDEREEFIRLKTFELVQKVSLYTITLLAIAYMLYPQMPAFVPLMLIVVSSMYSEIAGKLYFRRKY